MDLIDVRRVHGVLLGASILVGCAESGGGDDGEGADDGAATKADDLDEPAVPTVVPDACAAACTVEEQCLGGSPEACNEGCATDHNYFSDALGFGCVQDFEALLRCIGALDCGGAEAYAEGYDDGYPCAFEEETFVAGCILDGAPPSAACVAVCAKAAECELLGQAECEASCAQQLDFAAAIAEGCGAAQTELLVCAGTLACAELRDFYEGDPAVCADATAHAESVCAM